nr:hypothetical protein [Tanacetum cinerariifolium]
ISNEEIFQAKGDLLKSIQTFLEKFNCIPFEERPQILFQTWETFFAIQCSQPEDSNELFQKPLKDLNELVEYDQSTRTNHPIFLNDPEDHPVQNRESTENFSEEIIVSNPDQEKEPEVTTDTELSSTEDIHPLAVQGPPQDSDIHQLIEECSIEVPEQQKQKMEDTIFEMVKICQEKEFLCIHDDVNNLIESALDSKLLSINSINSQRLNKKEQEAKNVEEQPAERRNRAEKSLQNFRVVHKKSNAENLLPIPSKCEVTLEDEIECDMPSKDVCSPVFTTFSNPLFKDNDDLDSGNDESLSDEDVPAEEFKIYSNPLYDEDKINSDKLDPHCFNVESDFVESLLNQEIRFFENLLYDNSFPRPPKELNAEIADTIIESIPLLPIPIQDGNSQQEEIDIVTSSDDVLPPSVENDDDDYDLLLEEADLFLSDDSIPPGIENVADDPEGDICFLEELLIDDSILSYESFNPNFEDSPSISRPPLEPPDDNFDLESGVISAVMEDIDEPDEHFNPGREIFVSTKNEDVDYFPFMFDIRIFLPYFILPEISPLLLSAESEDTIFDLVQDGNSQQEEIDIVTETDDVLPSSIENFVDDPEGDIQPPDVETDVGEEIAVVMISKEKFDDDSQIFMFDKVFSLLFAEKIPKSDFDFEEEIHLTENLLYDNSFPRPPKELNAEIVDTIIESIPLPIPVQDGNSQQEE